MHYNPWTSCHEWLGPKGPCHGHCRNPTLKVSVAATPDPAEVREVHVTGTTEVPFSGILSYLPWSHSSLSQPGRSFWCRRYISRTSCLGHCSTRASCQHNPSSPWYQHFPQVPVTTNWLTYFPVISTLVMPQWFMSLLSQKFHPRPPQCFLSLKILWFSK